ncbi:nucleotidyl transferase AbiEii/AbiGii toxin family protein [Mucilaginibacter aquaedulcis]|uniref:nucleotidyl transferase AbiEii/AbiGii toxin family protein n=1 Tax=Mucilaginibacter aquaedulcis TaxID=1187081 RepID=UPI0025B34165|nr:nucleotidyl transferase AbiEii/AbiGii toxin family protein [Mucilaginibacter aquaedulcis]MDN3550516.1 nucleotidyl transferase AbiEii/AbiGii toxin family protein [Mucilaginibacter aquaedulcis]
MLHEETVKPGTLDLIYKLMRDQHFQFFYLVGGTALALKLGHRESIDIDLFNTGDFDAEKLAGHLEKQYNALIRRQKSNYVSGSIFDVDFDLISHKYPVVKQIETIQGIRMMSLEDIAAMKINAIVHSGQRIKDFIDIHYLLQEFEYNDILEFYCNKYPNVDRSQARNSLLYHNDIDFNVPVILKDKSLRWQHVRASINDAIAKHDRERQNQEFNRDDDNSEDIGPNRGGYKR